FFFSSRRRHTRCYRDWSSDVCSSDLVETATYRWTRVATLDLDEVRHLYPIIWTLEMLAISLAQHRFLTSDLERMREANARLYERSEERRVGKECGFMCMRCE